MSQRSALLISLMLTIIVGIAIVANRDRLLQASPAPVVSEKTAVVVQDDLTSGQTPIAEQNGNRVLEVTLPAVPDSLTGAPSSADDDRYDDDDQYDDDQYGDDDQYDDDDRYDDDQYDDDTHERDDHDEDDRDDDHEDDDHEEDDDH